MKIHDMESHPAADIFPMMSGEEFEALKTDIEENGQMEAIVLDPEDRILDGRNRYKACVDLGWSDEDIEFVGYDDDSPVTYVISMNLKRRHLNESQRAMVAAKARELFDEEASARMKAGRPVEGTEKGRSAAKAASTTNVSERSVYSAGKVLKGGSPKLIAAVETGQIAVDAAKLIADKEHTEQDEITDLVVTGTAKNLRQAVRMFDEARRVEKSKKGGKKRTNVKVLRGDAREVLRTLKKSSAHVALFDGPYGIETHSTRRGGKDYMDGLKYIQDLYPPVFQELKRVLVANGHGYAFAGYDWVWLIRDLLEKAGFYVQRNPIIWVKDNHTMADFDKHYPNKHEYILHFKQPKGMSRKLRACVPDTIPCARSNVTTHSAEKPVELLKVFIEQSSDPGETILDPFLGAGATLVAAAELGRSGVGIELDDNWADVAESRL